MQRSTLDHSWTIGLCVSLLAHGAIALAFLRLYAVDLERMRYFPAERRPAPVAYGIYYPSPQTAIPKPPEPKLTPPPEKKPTPRPRTPEKPLLMPEEFGESDGRGTATHSSSGETPMAGMKGPQEQAWLSRDPVGPGRLPEEPSRSTLLPGMNGDNRPRSRAGLGIVSPPSPPRSAEAAARAPVGIPLPPVLPRIAMRPPIRVQPPAEPPTPPPPAREPEQAPPASSPPPPSAIVQGPSTRAVVGHPASTRPAELARATTLPALIALQPQTRPTIPDALPTTRPAETIATKPPTTRPAQPVAKAPQTRPAELAARNPATRPADRIAQKPPTTQPATLAQRTPSTQPSPRVAAATRPVESIARLEPSTRPAVETTRVTRETPGIVVAKLPTTLPTNSADTPRPAQLAVAGVKSPPALNAASSPQPPSPGLISPGAGPGGAGPAGPPVPAADPAPMSTSESDAFTAQGSIVIRSGRIDARLGRKVRTVKPRLPLRGELDLSRLLDPRITMKVSIDETGKVTDVAVLKSSGSNEIDLPTRLAIYKWWIEPAKNRAGQPMRDVILLTISWH